MPPRRRDECLWGDDQRRYQWHRCPAGSGIVRNAGTISGGTKSISFIGTGTNTLILQTGSVLNGNAAGSTVAGATNKLILQGSGTVNNDFTNFNSLDIEASDAWVLNGNSTVGATTVNSGTLGGR